MDRRTRARGGQPDRARSLSGRGLTSTPSAPGRPNIEAQAKDAPVTRLLAEFVHAATWDSLPPAVVDRTALQILDCLGCAAVGSRMPWVRQVAGYALETARTGASTVMDHPPMAPEWAALVNATSAHSFELDDYHTGALSHPGCVVVPTVFAVGEHLGSTGRDVIVATALGLETIVRIGLATVPSMVVDRGFHETCAQGVFGAAIATGKLLGMSAAEIVSSMGVAGSHASGTREYSHSKGEVKRLHAGLGAAGGIRGAMLAARGFGGPEHILEGSRGFMQAFADRYTVDAIADGLGAEWHFMSCGFKPYASCGLIHAPTDALRWLMSEHGLTPDNVEEIHVGIDRLSLEHCCSLPIPPIDMNGAQFNLPYSLGMTLAMGGNGFAEYWHLQQHGFDDPKVVEAARRVRFEIDSEVDAAFPRDLVSKVRVRRSDGATFARTAKARGSKDHPLTPDEIRDKFETLIKETRWAPRGAEIVASVDRLKTDGNARAVMRNFQ